VQTGLNFDVQAGEVLAIMGASGSGKSTLLRHLVGLQPPVLGRVWLQGVDMYKASDTALNTLRQRFGVMFQGGALFSTLTVGENVEVPLRKYYPELSTDLRQQIARYKVILTGLPESAVAKFPSELSGGMRKRAGLARALALDPELLFLDEPTAGLDPIGAANFDRLTRELKETLGLTVFLITHDLDTLYEICDRVAVIADKRIIAVGTIPELIATGHPWIEEYFNGPRGRAALASHDRNQAGG
jgi:phospholipid/cholesterol/gamma-HCH transport system ATP-binding protein